MAERGNAAFGQALSNFIHDFASGGAIRHLADAGYTVTEISERLSFPTPKEKVAAEVWKYYLEIGRVRLEEPTDTDAIRRVSYVKEQNAYGRVSMRQVVEEIPMERMEYVACDFGKQLYRDREGFVRRLACLSDKEKQYILDLPWPLQTVYHVADDRMKEIRKKLEDGYDLQ